MIKFIDLFAGLGGIRLGFEQACHDKKIKTQCVFTSEVKPYAVEIYKNNFFNEHVFGDITQIVSRDIPDFDFLLAGFPCQAFSSAGKKHGFLDARGTLFFDIVRILKDKNPSGFLLENVESLVTHDKVNKNDVIGKTLNTILSILENLGYMITWKVLNSFDFGIPQVRKRIYILGHKYVKPTLDNFYFEHKSLSSILEKNIPCQKTLFRERLLSIYDKEFLYGKFVKDKRGGKENIHSWDLELKGFLSIAQKDLMSQLLKERRKKHWAEKKGIVWMDGMPLTLDEIHSFHANVHKIDLQEMLDDLVQKKYLKYEHPKDLFVLPNGQKKRIYDTTKEKGYNIVTGKLSFEINHILNPKQYVNTLVATEMDRLGVIDNDGIRNLTQRECFRLFGFPETYSSNLSDKYLYDLIGNTVVIPVIKEVSDKLLDAHFSSFLRKVA